MTPTICKISYAVYTTSIFYDITHYLWHHMHCIHDITPNISEMACNVSVSSQQLHWWFQTNCMHDITPALPMPSYALYTTSHPLFMTSHHCRYNITSTAFMTSHTLYMKSHTWKYKRYYLPSDPLYLTLHPLYLCHQTQGITDTTPTPSMTSPTL